MGQAADGVKQHFEGLLAFLGAMALLYAFMADVSRTVLVWVFFAAIVGAAKLAQYGDSSKAVALGVVRWRVVLFVLVMAAAGVYFGGCNVANRVRFAHEGEDMLWDEALLNVDEALLGVLFPRGQLSLWLDTDPPLIGITSPVALLYTEVLQVLYFSYYLWGNGLGIYLAYHYYKAASARPGGERKGSMSPELQWRRLMLFMCAWTGTFLFNFLLNVLIPAVSPRIYLEDQYSHEVRGVFFANVIRAGLKKAAANSFSAFPSGHCGISFLTFYVARSMGFNRYAKACGAASALIMCATLVLRYHYFADMLAAVVLVVFGVVFGFMEDGESLSAALRPPAIDPSPKANTADKV